MFGTGPKVGTPLVIHPRVRVISFTGSTVVGKFIQEKSAPFIKKLSLEVCFKLVSEKFSHSIERI